MLKKETIWNEMRVWQRRGKLADEFASKMAHLSLADVLFIRSIANLEKRPHGLMTWMAEMFQNRQPLNLSFRTVTLKFVIAESNRYIRHFDRKPFRPPPKHHHEHPKERL